MRDNTFLLNKNKKWPYSHQKILPYGDYFEGSELHGRFLEVKLWGVLT